MVMNGTVTVVTGSLYRINISGSLSAPVPRLTSACRLRMDSGLEQYLPPAVGDSVLCWFPGDAFRDGCIIGILEG